ncbi:MAG: MoaD/ThiS family protein [Rhodospirillaceae bacterium]
MKIRIKLYASLGAYLPAGAKQNESDLDVADGATPAGVIAKLGLPGDMCHLVLVNGLFCEPSARASQALQDGDALAIWPPVAGG